MRLVVTVTTICFIFLCAATTRAQECLGQHACEHERMHEAYQEMFSTMKCHCGAGNCRPTRWEMRGGTPHALVNGEMCPVPDDAFRALGNFAHLLSEEALNALMRFDAHVCAVLSTEESSCEFIECFLADLGM